MLESLRIDGTIRGYEVKDSMSEPSGLGTQGDTPGRCESMSEDSGTESPLTPPLCGSVPLNPLGSGTRGGSFWASPGWVSWSPNQSEDLQSFVPGVSSAPRGEAES